MKFLFLSIMLALTSCAILNKQTTINDFRPHMFSDDKKFITENAKCENIFNTDKFNSVDNEIFRCSADNSNTFIALESDGNNSENLKYAVIIWKEWKSDLNYEASRTKAQQFAAIFAQLYARDKKIEMVDAFLNTPPKTFKSQLYDIEVTEKDEYFYKIRKAVVTFK